MTRRFSIETLERRQMYAAHPLVDYIDADEVAVSVAAGDVNNDGVAEVALARDPSRPVVNGLVGDFNGDGRDDVAGLFGSVDYNHPDLYRRSSVFPSNGSLLPFMEQDNVYKLSEGASREVAGIDVWEHAYLQGPAANGIIAVLIGLIQPETDGSSNTLVVDPSDPSGNTVFSSFADGSVRFLGTDVSGTREMGAVILASDEYFARFANTTPDDEAVAAGRSNKPTQVTHDREFENWANVRGFDRGYLPPGA